MSRKISRRDFIKTSVAGSVALAAQGPLKALAASQSPPNILVIMVDEMRLPYGSNVWIPVSMQQRWLPNLHRLWSRSACFHNHFTAAVACSPSRASLVTGLYAQQHMLLSTITQSGSPFLQTAFPTWGSALQGMNYDAYWLGKWHLSNPQFTQLSDYGFGGVIVDDPDGLPGQGQRRDPEISGHFLNWLAGRQGSGASKPFCTTVSFVNPHDIAWFYKDSDCVPGQAGPFPTFGPGFLDSRYFTFGASGVDPCPNFENPWATSTPKPSLQKAFAAAMNSFGGGISYDPSTAGQPPSSACSGGAVTSQPFSQWYKYLQLYFYLHSMVDAEIGKVLDALAASPYADNTIVIFTADHGDYAGAHGMRMKGASAYEEAIKIPLTVFDPTGRFVSNVDAPRMGLTSSVDILPLLMSLASPDPNHPTWQYLYPYLAGRHPLLPMLGDSSAPGRNHVLFSTDEYVSQLGGSDPAAPYHVLTLRTAQGKLSTYSYWKSQTAQIDPSSVELEVYDYRVPNGILEIPNVASTSDLTAQYLALLLGTNGSGGLNAAEMQGKLPPALAQASQLALAQYLQYLARISGAAR